MRLHDLARQLHVHPYIRHLFDIYPEVTAEKVDVLNVCVHRLIRMESRRLMEVPHAILPKSVVDRISRSPRFSMGFTGFKMAYDLSDGLAGQLLCAVMPTREMAFNGGRVAEWAVGDRTVTRAPKFYYVVVPDCIGARYEMGQVFPLPADSRHLRRIVIDFSEQDFLKMFQRGYELLAQIVLDGEKDFEEDLRKEGVAI